ncbi:MAG: hypothetical protein AAF581_10550 [Planctomycetota bacterium]
MLSKIPTVTLTGDQLLEGGGAMSVLIGTEGADLYFRPLELSNDDYRGPDHCVIILYRILPDPVCGLVLRVSRGFRITGARWLTALIQPDDSIMKRLAWRLTNGSRIPQYAATLEIVADGSL